jgi:hypothetical protein
LLAAEHRIAQVDLENRFEVFATRRTTGAPASAEWTSTATAKEGVEDVSEVCAEWPCTLSPTLAAETIVAESVIASPTVGVAKNFVRVGDFLEACLGIWVVGVLVGVKLASELAISLFDLCLASLRRDAKNVVMVGHQPSLKRLPSDCETSATAAMAWG